MLAARSCLQVALLKLSQDQLYQLDVGQSSHVKEDNIDCDIQEVKDINGLSDTSIMRTVQITTQGIYKNERFQLRSVVQILDHALHIVSTKRIN